MSSELFSSSARVRTLVTFPANSRWFLRVTNSVPLNSAATTANPQRAKMRACRLTSSLLRQAQQFLHRVVRSLNLAFAKDVSFQAEFARIAVVLEGAEDRQPVEMLGIREQRFAFGLNVQDARLVEQAIPVRIRLLKRCPVQHVPIVRHELRG